MAKVDYGFGVPTVAPETRAPDDYQHANVGAASFGGGIAEGGKDLGQGIVKAATFYNEAAIDDQTNELFTRWNKRLRGDPTKQVPGPNGQMMPDTGFMGTQGRTTLDMRPQLEKDMDADFNEIRQNLAPAQQEAFDRASRGYRRNVLDTVDSHAGREANQWYKQVNKSTEDIALTHIANNADNPEAVAAGAADLINARVKQTQLEGGGEELVRAAIIGGKRDALKAQLDAVAVKDPKRAVTMLEKNRNIAGTSYDDLSRSYRDRAERQTGIEYGEQALKDTYKQVPEVPSYVPVVEQVSQQYGISSDYFLRTIQLESGGKRDAVSKAGAKGLVQMMDKTAQQYGLTNPFDEKASIDTAARLAVDNKRVMTANFGRPPTDAELYLAHQQGATGASRLLQNPTVRAGDLVGDERIRQNGGDPNAPAAAFTSMWATKFGGAASAVRESLSQRKAQAYDKIAADPNLSPSERQHALTYVNQQIASAQVAQDATLRAKKEQNDQAMDGYVQRMLKGDMVGMLDQIVADPNLTPQSREHLGNAVLARSAGSVEQSEILYGKGYWQAYKAVAAPSGDPSRITDINQLYSRVGPGGDLTLEGAQRLSTAMKDMQKSPDTSAVHNTKISLIAYAKGKLSFEQDTGPIKIRDPKGEALFNAQFIPKFEAAYASWVKEGKDPFQFLTQENVDKISQGLRNKREMEMDRLAATGQSVPEDKNAPPPPVPQGVNPAGWSAVMAKPPATEAGTPFPKTMWAQAVTMLAKNPTPENIKMFNESKFGKRAGFEGGKIVEQLLGKKSAPAAAATVAPAPTPTEPTMLESAGAP